MNTPAHTIASLLLLGRAERPERVWPIAIGSVVPDAPMFVFYALETARGVPEMEIWRERYFDPGWQFVFDLFNSLPLIGLGLFFAWRLGAGRGLALLLSMAVHCVLDLPLHQADAHRHFYPLSSWRFESPISYWDPAAGGWIVTLLEIALVAVGSAVLWRRLRRPAHRGLLLGIGAIYALYFAYVVKVWL